MIGKSRVEELRALPHRGHCALVAVALVLVVVINQS